MTTELEKFIKEKVEEVNKDEQIRELFPNLSITYIKLGVEHSNRGSYNKLLVTMQNNNKVARFEFHDSIYNYEKGIYSSALDMLYCCVTDATCYLNIDSVEDFMREFGYEDIDFATKTYNACADAYSDLIELFGEKGFEELQRIMEDY